jgi:hypothetical protein
MLKLSFPLGFLLAATFVSAARAEDGEKDSKTPKPLTFQTPKGWRAVDADFISLARFQIREKDRIASMTVTALNGDGGGLVANVNRWRAQVGLKPLAEKDALKSLQAIKVDGIAGHVLDLTGPDTDGKSRRILAAVVKKGNQTWFFKLMGPASLVGEQKTAFEEFLKSVRFEK